MQNCIYGLPLVALPIYNFAIAEAYSFTVVYIFHMVIASVIEEIVFRGIVFELLNRYDWKVKIFMSSSIFAIAHLINLMGEMNCRYVVIQILFAFIIGICFAEIVIYTQSIILCIVTHIAINVSAGNELEVESGLWICLVIYIAYGVYLYLKIKTTKGKLYETIH